MIYAEKGNERCCFIGFIENALGILSKEDYRFFLDAFDSSRLTEADLVLALRYLDATRPVIKIDNPALVRPKHQAIDFFTFTDGSGYLVDYDLSTNGELNDLTIQITFLRKENGYLTELDDLHTL